MGDRKIGNVHQALSKEGKINGKYACTRKRRKTLVYHGKKRSKRWLLRMFSASLATQSYHLFPHDFYRRVHIVADKHYGLQSRRYCWGIFSATANRDTFSSLKSTNNGEDFWRRLALRAIRAGCSTIRLFVWIKLSEDVACFLYFETLSTWISEKYFILSEDRAPRDASRTAQTFSAQTCRRFHQKTTFHQKASRQTTGLWATKHFERRIQ